MAVSLTKSPAPVADINAPRSYTLFGDPDHAWLCVTEEEAKRLNVYDRISDCSYRKYDLLYLEEDCDAPLFIEAKKALGEPYHIKYYPSNTDSPIRNLRHFEA